MSTFEEAMNPEYIPIYHGFKHWSMKAKGADPESLTPIRFAELAREYRERVSDAMHELKEHGTRSYRAYYFSKVQTKRVSSPNLSHSFTNEMTTNELYFYEQFRKWSLDAMRRDPSTSTPREFNALMQEYIKWVKRASRGIVWVHAQYRRQAHRGKVASPRLTYWSTRMPQLSKKDIEGMKKLSKEDAKEVFDLMREMKEHINNEGTLTTYIDPEIEEFKAVLNEAEKTLKAILKAKITPDLPRVRIERVKKIGDALRRLGRSRAMKDTEAIEQELKAGLLAGIKPANMNVQTLLYEPEGEKRREVLAHVFMEKGLVVPEFLVKQLDKDFLKENVAASKRGGHSRKVPSKRKST